MNMTPMIIICIACGAALALTVSVCVVTATARLGELLKVACEIADLLAEDRNRRLRLWRNRKIIHDRQMRDIYRPRTATSKELEAVASMWPVK